MCISSVSSDPEEECLVCLIAPLSGMVSITVVTSCSTSNQPTLQSRAADSTCVATLLSHSRDIRTSRLAAMQQRMQASRISETKPKLTYLGFVIYGNDIS